MSLFMNAKASPTPGHSTPNSAATSRTIDAVMDISTSVAPSFLQPWKKL